MLKGNEIMGDDIHRSSPPPSRLTAIEIRITTIIIFCYEDNMYCTNML